MRVLELERLVRRAADSHGEASELLVLTLHGEPVAALISAGGSEPVERVAGDPELQSLLDRAQDWPEVTVLRYERAKDAGIRLDEGPEQSKGADVVLLIHRCQPGEEQAPQAVVFQAESTGETESDDETARVAASSKFRSIIERSRTRYKAEGGISSEEMRRRLGLD